MKLNLKKLKDSKGMITIETLFAMSFILLILILTIGYFLYFVPKQVYTQDVDILAKQAASQGGLTPQNIADMKNRLSKGGIDPNEVTVQVSLLNLDGSTFTNYNSLNKGSVNPNAVTDISYITKKDNVIIQVKATIPADNSVVKAASSALGGKEKLNDTYVWTKEVLSEKE